MPWISRIAKLLEAEFFELKEPILAESPFTEITVEGIGVRQYHIGLTSSKLFFASDNFDGIDLNNYNFRPTSRVPECETLSLVKMVPLYELRVRFCAKDGRRIMNICSEIEKCDKISLEMGGHFYKEFLWHTFWTQIACLQHVVPIFNMLSCNECHCSDGGSSLSSYYSLSNRAQSKLETEEEFSPDSELED